MYGLGHPPSKMVSTKSRLQRATIWLVPDLNRLSYETHLDRLKLCSSVQTYSRRFDSGIRVGKPAVEYSCREFLQTLAGGESRITPLGALQTTSSNLLKTLSIFGSFGRGELSLNEANLPWLRIFVRRDCEPLKFGIWD